MENFKTFEEFVNESEKMNEFLNTDLKKTEDFIRELSRRVSDFSLISSIKKLIAIKRIDPYESFQSIMREIARQFSDEPEVLRLVQLRINEFEGSLGPATQLSSDLFLATQTAANGIAF